jgi:hypothetical protein
MSEHDEQATLFAIASYRPELRWMFAIPNGGYRTKATAGKMAAEGVKAGVWDIYLPRPSNGYHGLFIEMKYGKNKLTELQQEFFEYATQQGYLCKVAYSADEAIEIIDDYLGLNDDEPTC